MDSIKNVINNIYDNFVQELNKNNHLYNTINELIDNSIFNVSILKSISLDNLDIKWLKPVEESLMSFNEVIKNPIHYIESYDDLVKVEKSKQVTKDSIRHLSKNSKYVNKYNDYEIIPSKILNSSKEDSIITYENRFVFTLLRRLEIFIEKRLDNLKDNYLIDDSSKLNVNGECELLGGIFSYKIDFKYSFYENPNKSIYDLDYDTTGLNMFLRIKRIKSILDGFNNTSFYRELRKAPVINSNIIMTNVLLNNPDFVNLVNLWEYLDNYKEGIGNDKLLERSSYLKDYFYNEVKALVMMQFASFLKIVNEETVDSFICKEDYLNSNNTENNKIKNEIKFVEAKTIKIKEDSYYVLKMKNILKRAIGNGKGL